MRVLGLAADGAFAVLETDGRTIEAFGPSGTGEIAAILAGHGGVDLVGTRGDGEALARLLGVPVACGFGPDPALDAVYFRARVRALGLERPTAVIDGAQVIVIEANGLLVHGADPGRARSVIQAADLGAFWQAEAMAYLAARCWNGFPIAFPGTTGAPYPMPLGRIARPS